MIIEDKASVIIFYIQWYLKVSESSHVKLRFSVEISFSIFWPKN